MSGFFDRMLGRNNNPSKGSSSTAKDRLKFVLLHERVSITPEKMREMKEEIIAVIAKYVPGIDPDTVDIAIEQSDRYDNKLVAEIPFTKSRGIPAVDIDGNDDLAVSDDDSSDDDASMNEAIAADTEFSFIEDDETIPNPSIQPPDVDVDEVEATASVVDDAPDSDDD